jgi:hypothetical protein
MLLSDLFRVGDTVRSRFNRQVRRVRCSPIQAGAWLMRVQSVKSVCLTADISPSASYLEKSKVAPSPSNQGCLLLAWFLLRRNTLTPTTLRGPAPNGHPCPDGALAASMRLGPLRVVCVRPAPKSRFVSSECYVHEVQKQINSFPAEAGPTVGAHRTGCMRLLSRTVEEVWAGGRGASGAAFPRRAWERSSSG